MSQPNNWWHFYIEGCLCRPCIDYCIRYGVQLTEAQNKKITERYPRDQNDYDLHLSVERRYPQIEEIDDQDANSLHFQPMQSNLNNQNSRQIVHHMIPQHEQPMQSNNQNSRQIVHQNNLQNEFLQQLLSQNQLLITMIQNISNIPSIFTNTCQSSIPQNNDTIANSQNTPLLSVPQNNDQNARQPSSNFSNHITESSSNHQINICDSCMRSNFSNQTTSVSVSQINNNQIISNQVTNISEPQNSTPSQDITATQHISNCTTN
ncbi:33411_t:CDS:2, partial [Racocetra persica]